MKFVSTRRMSIVTLVYLLSGLLTLFFMSLGCSGPTHLEIADKHIAKAKEKGSFVVSDTLYKYIYQTDTLYKEGKVISITKKVVDSIPYAVTNTTVIYKHLSRQERKALKDSLNHAENMYALETKRSSKLAKTNVELQNKLSKRLKQEYKQNTKQTKADKRTWLDSLLYVIIALTVLIIALLVLFRFILPK